ncbi:hypothetical protein APR41_05010 [Salegentibacter salinarum]|uniref:Transposase IS200-like domain-containing protein n=1 Tax=Salegentibacter salinarum TaxID=447422 RepID=A0A2N0TS54_9FLAO|nr:hypothetical protein [Salegentibacter salinarum]PKD17572.1 hypothetical protein APR41_05010 [Salegentibacter salinarum]SKB48921.1 hypothetical protein SAMN05660903_01027 [Salegentibacter salinarum]
MKYEPIAADSITTYITLAIISNQYSSRKKIIIISSALLKNILIPVANIYAYCLIKIHFQILVKTKTYLPDLKIPKAFSNLFNAYAKAINKTHNCSGSLFQDRFKRKIIKNEEYLKTLIPYIDLNPKNHKIIDNFVNYKHPSYSRIILSENSFLSENEVIELFNDKSNFSYVHSQRQAEILKLDKNIFLE